MVSEIEDPSSDRMRKIFRGLHKIGLTNHIMRLGLLIYAKTTKLNTKKFNLFAIGQSHLDSAWNWRWIPDTAPYKLSHTVGYNFCNMEIFKEHKYPTHNGGYKFAFSSPAHYEYLEKNFPAAFKKIQRLVKQGRWEIVGGMWVEADVNVPDGESLVRQRLYGQRYYLEKFGRISLVEWEPDTFGFGNSLPQILVKSGSPYFHTTKITWNTEHEFPFFWFYWQSPDGSKVLSSNIKNGFRGLESIYKYEENARLVKKEHENSRIFDSSLDVYNDSRLSKDHITDYLWTYGQGDGGHGPWQIECIIADTLEQINRMQLIKASLFYKYIEKKYRAKLPIWDDELYLEIHRGCQTTLYRLKKQNRLAEIHLQTFEKMAVFASLLEYEFPKEEYDSIWKKVLFNHFHDILPGSSIQEVYEDSDADFKSYFPIINEWESEIFSIIASSQKPQASLGEIIAFFPNTFGLPSKVPKNYSDSDSTLPDIPDYYFLNGPENNSIGFKVISPKNKDNNPKISYKITDSILEISHPKFNTKINLEKAIISSLSFNDSNAEIVNLNGEGVNVLKIYYDLPKGNDAWNIDPNYRKQREDTIKILSHEIIESQEGILIVFQLSVGEKSKARMIYEIYPSIYYIETHLEIDWNEEHRFLRVEFDTSIQNRFLFSGQPYSLIKRPTIREAPLEKGKWEFPGQYFIAMDNANDKGLAVLVTNRYGFDCEGGRMGMSLLRSPSFDPPDKNACAWYDPKTLPDRQKIKDLGHHILSWSIMPYIGDIKTGKVYEHAINYAYKPLYRRIGDVHQIDLPKTRQSVDSMAIQIDNPKIFFSVAKYPYGENKMKSIILRFVELYGDNESFRLSWSKDFQICEVVEVDLLEFPLKNKNKSSDSIHLSESGDSILLEISPFEIKTFKLIFK